MIRRAAAVALLVLGLTTAGPALAASAAPVVTVGPVAAKACATAPEPASPFAGLSGKFYGEPATASDADPFTNESVKIADVYGYAYRWVVYDNGCLPGADALPQAQTGIANLLLGGSAAVSAFTHGLFSMVVTPDFLAPLDGVLTTATGAIKGGFWDPWVTAVLILVAAGVLVAAMRSEVSSAVTTVGWALLVLVGATYVMSYPVSSARAVDELVQTTVATPAEAIGANETYGPPVPSNQGHESASRAQAALDDMFDTINRDVFYNAWLEGAVGSSDSAVARAHGPDLFRASHLSWSEAETVKNDPDAGQAIVQAKKELWVQTAAAVEREDAGAYQQLTGNNGRWDAAGTVALRVGVMMPFLAVAAVFIVVAYVVTRVFVPLAPAFGVLGLLYVAQDWVVGVLKQVGRFIVLGPAFFVAALANLLLDTAVLDSELVFGLQLVIVAAIPFVLFKLLRPGRAVAGSRAARRMARFGLGTLVNTVATRRAVREGVDDAQDKDRVASGEAPTLRREPSLYRYAYPKSSPVATGDTMEISAGGRRPRELPAAPPRELSEAPAVAGRGRYLDRGNEMSVAQPGERALPRRSRRELAAVGAGSEPGAAAPRTRDTFAPGSDENISIRARAADTSGLERGQDKAAAGARERPTIRPDDRDIDLAARVDKNVPRGEVLGHSTELPIGVVEATTRYDDEGHPVFEVWRPPSAARTNGDDPEEYR